MRDYILTYGGTKTATVTIPENVVWKGDRNIVKVVLSDTTDTVKVKVTLTNTDDNISLEFASSFNWLTLDITDIVRQITLTKDDQTAISVKVTATDTGGTETQVTLNEDFYVHEGRTLGGRRHGANCIIRAYTSAHPVVEVYNGEYIEDFDTSAATPAADGNYYTSWTSGGGMLDPLNGLKFVQGQEQYVKVKEVCEPAKAVWLKFWNTDGCERIVAAKPMMFAETSKGVQYASDYPAVNIMAEVKTQIGRTLTLGIPDVEYAEYLTDIALSDKVEWSMEASEWWPCTVKAVNYSQDGGTHAMKIDIITNN